MYSNGKRKGRAFLVRVGGDGRPRLGVLLAWLAAVVLALFVVYRRSSFGGEGAAGGAVGLASRKLLCKVWKETDLRPSRKPEDRLHDKFMVPMERASVRDKKAKWAMKITEDQEFGWLGAGGDYDRSRYVHGTAEADRRVQELGYCRITMPSLPRTGSSWFRLMIETATGRPTASMWPDGGQRDEHRQYFINKDPCGASPHQLEASKKEQEPFPCRNLTLPGESDPVLFKTHVPFLASYDRYSSDSSKVCMVLLLVRNPIDSHHAVTTYFGREAPVFREFLPRWGGHMTHWLAEARGSDIPIISFRYEDMLRDTAGVLRRVLSSLPGRWEWSEKSIAKAVELYGPQASFEEKCGNRVPKYTVTEVEMVRKHYTGTMQQFGYTIEKVL